MSSTISAKDAPHFFQKYAVFYQENAEMGQVASSLARKALSDDVVSDLKPILEKDDVSTHVEKSLLDNY